jgi:hypothetical protein
MRATNNALANSTGALPESRYPMSFMRHLLLHELIELSHDVKQKWEALVHQK